MNISCEIIKDLLPLYHDGVCSAESKSFVEDHLAHCDSCKSELLAMNEVISINGTKQNLREADAVKKLSKRWRREKIKSSFFGVICTVLLIAIVLFIMLFLNIRIF